MTKKNISSKLHNRLKKHANEFSQKREEVNTGFKFKHVINERKKRIMLALQANQEDWNNWHWQLRNRISCEERLSEIFDIDQTRKQGIKDVTQKFRWGITPYYLSLMDVNNPNCPTTKQMLPDPQELKMTGLADFSGEELTSPVPYLVRWYPDRVIIKVTNVCAGFCRHCLRRRHIGEEDVHTTDEHIDRALDYVREHSGIRDVLLTGGDPLSFSDRKLARILEELNQIEHVEIKRIGSRIPIVMPQRIDNNLCKMLKKYHPLYLNIQANHPLEITADVEEACNKLTMAGIPLGNQSVLLKGINDRPEIIKVLNHELLKIRVKPYYLYHCQGTIGISHMRTPVETGIDIIEKLRGYTSGMAVPDYIITPTGYGKTPLSPNYHMSSGDGFLTLRNWEGTFYRYENPTTNN